MIPFEHWGEIEYSLAEQRQHDDVEKLQNSFSPKDEKIIFCSHPPVVTLGKQSKKADIQDWSGPIFEVKRGGQATYHGPGQIVVYLILNLKMRGNDVLGLLRLLENCLVKTLNEYHLISSGNPDSTGVWAKEFKVASIGMAIKRGITYHGMAINLYEDPLAFQNIRPCGLDANIMTSLEKLMQYRPGRKEFEDRLLFFLQEELEEKFSLQKTPSGPYTMRRSFQAKELNLETI